MRENAAWAWRLAVCHWESMCEEAGRWAPLPEESVWGGRTAERVIAALVEEANRVFGPMPGDAAEEDRQRASQDKTRRLEALEARVDRLDPLVDAGRCGPGCRTEAIHESHQRWCTTHRRWWAPEGTGS